MAQFVFVGWLVKFFESRDFEFEWDEGNETKNIEKHGIENSEGQDIFYDPELVILGEQKFPVVNEERFGIIGKTSSDKILFIAFTFRNLKIRIISVRSASIKEREKYER